MDLLDRLLGHDEWTTGECLRRCRELSPEQMRRRHNIEWGSVQATMLHMLGRLGLASLPEGDLLGWEETVSAGQEVATR